MSDPLDLCTCGHLLAEHPTDGRRCFGGAGRWAPVGPCACEAFTVQGTSTPIDPTAELDSERAAHARTQHALDVLFDLTQGALAGRATASDELAEANAALAEWGAFDLDLHALLAERLGDLPEGIDLIDAIRQTLGAAYLAGCKDQAAEDEANLVAAYAADLTAWVEGSASPFPPDPRGIVTEGLAEINAERGEAAR
jgi:hypothetical protein